MDTPACVPNRDGSCSICADEALPAVVIAVDAAARMAEVRLSDQVVTVALDLVDDPAPGETIMVHMGFAISRVGSRGE